MAKIQVEFQYSPGDHVQIWSCPHVLRGTVISMWASDRGEKYEVAYLVDGERKTDYFLEYELAPDDNDERAIGFTRQ